MYLKSTFTNISRWQRSYGNKYRLLSKAAPIPKFPPIPIPIPGYSPIPIPILPIPQIADTFADTDTDTFEYNFY